MNASKQDGQRRRKATSKGVARAEKAVRDAFEEAAAEPVPDRLAEDAKRAGKLLRRKIKGATGKRRHI